MVDWLSVCYVCLTCQPFRCSARGPIMQFGRLCPYGELQSKLAAVVTGLYMQPRTAAPCAMQLSYHIQSYLGD